MKNILFDLDGTIIEPQKGIINSILFALDKMGIKEENVSELKSFIGPPLIESFKNRYQLTDQEASLAVDCYREYYAVDGIFQVELYDGIEALLKELSATGIYLFIATSKPTVFAEKIASHFKINHFFQDVVGSNLDNTRNDKGEIINYVLETYQLDATETLMIGDTRFDMKGAKNNQLQAVGVSYGHGSVLELKEYGADHIVDSCADLRELLKNEGVF